jgi:hypothetical protein
MAIFPAFALRIARLIQFVMGLLNSQAESTDKLRAANAAAGPVQALLIRSSGFNQCMNEV